MLLGRLSVCMVCIGVGLNFRLKGGTYAGHKVDIEMIARRNKTDPAEFIIACDEKNRYGATGKRAVFRHTDRGILSIPNVGDLTRFGYKEE